MKGDHPTAAGIVPLIMDMKGYLGGDRFVILAVGESDETSVATRGELPPVALIYVKNLRYKDKQWLNVLILYLL
jgi:hypothetical protein